MCLGHQRDWSVQMSNMGMPLSWSLVDPIVAQDSRFKVGCQKLFTQCYAQISPALSFGASDLPDCLNVLKEQTQLLTAKAIKVYMW